MAARCTLLLHRRSVGLLNGLVTTWRLSAKRCYHLIQFWNNHPCCWWRRHRLPPTSSSDRTAIPSFDRAWRSPGYRNQQLTVWATLAVGLMRAPAGPCSHPGAAYDTPTIVIPGDPCDRVVCAGAFLALCLWPQIHKIWVTRWAERPTHSTPTPLARAAALTRAR